jgi:alkanesulfonate monooxygenase SsuD/methylene tetrahydromethanopterin reductase-like flavin-dependent oxidoreductase (luciferase family)
MLRVKAGEPEPAEALRTEALEYGVLLPHFGAHASRSRLLDAARAIERFGFDSVWVRDHLVYRPHGFEDKDATHVDPLVVLSAVASVTDKLKLAVGTLIPHRHPIQAALMLGSLEFMAGPGRVMTAWGIGAYDHEFEAIGGGEWDRRRLIGEQISIVRQLWSGRPVSFSGEFYTFSNVEIHPVPGESGRIPIWYGGPSAAAVRRAVEYCDGWIPGPIPLRIFRSRIARMQRLAGEAGRPTPAIGAIPSLVPARTVEDALARIDLPALDKFMTRLYGESESGPLRTLADFDSGVIAGPAEVIIDAVRRFQAEGLTHFVFDFRARFRDFDYCLGILGEEVLPELHRGDGRRR